MPVILQTPVRRLSQADFGDLAYSVMGTVFQIHRELGRFFDEKIYKRELARRHAGVEIEVPIEITYESFTKIYFIDVLVNSGGPFELKTVDAFVPRHPAQLLHYMLLAELGHGKLVNLRKESVEHEFVNTTLTREDRTGFKTAAPNWSEQTTGAERFREILISLLREWGTGLSLELYEEALTHFLGGEAKVLADVAIRSGSHSIGCQKMRLVTPGVAFALTALPDSDLPNFESHTFRFLRHTELDAILWANISLKLVTFTVIR